MARALDLLLFPVRQLPPMVGLVIVSLVTAVVVMLVFRATSDQQRIADVKRRIAAALFEIRLFNDDLPAVFRAQGELLRHNATYLRLSLVPMLWMIVPIALLVAQLEFRYGYTGLTPGRPAIVTVQLREGVKLATSNTTSLNVTPGSTVPGGTVSGYTRPDNATSRNVTAGGSSSGRSASADAVSNSNAALEAPPEISVLTPPVWFPASSEVVWRIRPEAAGDYELR